MTGARRAAARPMNRWRLKSPQRQTSLTWLSRVILLVTIVVLWELAAKLRLINPFLYGYPSGIWDEFLRLVSSGQLIADIQATLTATLVGFAIGMSTGSIVGLVLWYSRVLARLLDPLMVAFNGVPKIALAPLIIVWFGSGINSKIALAAFATFVIAVINVYEGTRQTDSDLVRLVLSLGGKKRDVFTKVVVPSTLPWVVSTLRINIGIALLATIGGEFVASNVGLGHTAFVAGYLFNLNAVWVSILTLMVLALALYAVLMWVEGALKAWLPASTGGSANPPV